MGAEARQGYGDPDTVHRSPHREGEAGTEERGIGLLLWLSIMRFC